MPTHGLITNCGKAHLEGFGGEEGVKKGKGELFDYLRAHHGTAFIYADYDYLTEMSNGIEKVSSYGTNTNEAELSGRLVADQDFLQVTVTKGADIKLIKTQLVGGYNLPNVLAAIAIGKYFRVPDDQIKNSLEHYVPSNSRSQLLEKNGHKIILDAYNANPTSMKAAIENFSRMEGSNKILMLGSMMELGTESAKEHQQIIELIGKYPWKNVVLVGEGFKPIHGNYLHFNNAAEAGRWFQEHVKEPAGILIKGSRSMQMEKILD
jgi:UDP-N-acetylmuramoyl-tripeptide--D-alanyl-D-alanine ligase